MIAQDFTLPDHNGKTHTLSEYRGKWVIVYFYPKDDTVGCTKEACSFRDAMQDLTAKNVVVIGISADTRESHQKFISKYDLNFILLSDETFDTIKKYKAWGTKSYLGKKYTGILRNTYLIDPQGGIAKIYENVSTEKSKHVSEILQDLASLQNK